jgi:hypothetical protein
MSVRHLGDTEGGSQTKEISKQAKKGSVEGVVGAQEDAGPEGWICKSAKRASRRWRQGHSEVSSNFSEQNREGGWCRSRRWTMCSQGRASVQEGTAVGVTLEWHQGQVEAVRSLVGARLSGGPSIGGCQTWPNLQYLQKRPSHTTVGKARKVFASCEPKGHCE